MNLRDDEEEDVILEEDLEELKQYAKFMELIHTTRKFIHAVLYGAMRSAWNLAQVVVFYAIEDNLLGSANVLRRLGACYEGWALDL